MNLNGMMPLAEANKKLRYRSRSTLNGKVKKGEIPGAFFYSGRWYVPVEWFETELQKQAEGPTGPGKPRGFEHNSDGA